MDCSQKTVTIIFAGKDTHTVAFDSHRMLSVETFIDRTNIVHLKGVTTMKCKICHKHFKRFM